MSLVESYYELYLVIIRIISRYFFLSCLYSVLYHILKAKSSYFFIYLLAALWLGRYIAMFVHSSGPINGVIRLKSKLLTSLCFLAVYCAIHKRH